MAEPGDAADADLVLVTVKSAATQAVADELKPVLRAGAIVISFQNGLRNADLLRAALPQPLRGPRGVAELKEVPYARGEEVPLEEVVREEVLRGLRELAKLLRKCGGTATGLRREFGARCIDSEASCCVLHRF